MTLALEGHKVRVAGSSSGTFGWLWIGCGGRYPMALFMGGDVGGEIEYFY